MRRYFQFLKIFLLIHFSIILVAQLAIPMPIIGDKYVQILEMKYVTPLFEQNWRMFAPNPPNSTNRILFKFRKNKIESQWLDVCKPIIEGNKSSYFSFNQRLLKYLHGTLSGIQKSYNKSILDKDGNLDKAKQTMGYKSLQQYAKLVYRTLDTNKYAGADKIVYLKIKIVNDAFPNFENRDLDFYDPKNHYRTYFEIPFEKLN